ncbi:MAG: YfhO family protein [Actinomycetota bacterium]
MNRERLLRAGAPVAGPALIVAAVLVVDHAFAFGGLLTNQHEDIVGLSLPTYCFLGKSLAAGHIPLWNPFSLAGLPFAADPQSGWMYLPAMVLFSTMSCARAMRWYIVLQPLLGGLGIYAFLRSERLSRAAATVGGVTLALVMAGSYIGLSTAFAAALAWTALMLAAASRLMRTPTWPARLGWLAATALAGGQLAAAYASNGLAIGAAALGVYLVVRVIGDLRSGRSWRLEAAPLVLLVAAAGLLNLAYLVPRFGYLSRATAALGYANLIHLQNRLTGVAFPPYRTTGAPATWALGLTVSPGSYVAVAALVLSCAAFFRRRLRGLAVGFAALGLVSYDVSGDRFARFAKAHLAGFPAADFYLHDPRRFRYGLIFAVAVLAGLGVQALMDAGSWRRRAAMLVPGVAIWLLLPLSFDVPNGHTGVWLFGVVAGGAALALACWRPRLAIALPVVIAVEMAAGGLSGQSTKFELDHLGVSSQDPGAFTGLLGPAIDAGAYTTPDLLARKLQAAGGGRYLTFAPKLIHERDGFLPLQTPDYWDLEANGRGMLFGLEDADGYNSVAPIPYWAYNRVADPKPIRYNLTYYKHLTPQILDLLDVRWIVGSWHAKHDPVAGLARVASDGRQTLYRVTGASLDVGSGPRSPQRASFVGSWRVLPVAQAAREAVTATGFDPRAEVVLQEDPGLGGSPRPGAPAGADVGDSGPQSLSLTVDAPRPGLVLVRIPWDPHWTVTVDGRRGTVLKADAFLMAVPVEHGRHDIRFAYVDGSVGLGLLGTSASLVALAAAAAFLWLRRRRHPSAGTGAGDAESAPAGGTEAPEAPQPVGGGGRGGSGRSPPAKR